MSHIQYTSTKFEPIARPGEYIALPANLEYSKFLYYRVVDVEPVDNLVLTIVPRKELPKLSKIEPLTEAEIPNPYELRLSKRELLQLCVKYVNFPIKYRVEVGQAKYNSYSVTDLWFDWNTPWFLQVFYFTGEPVLNGEVPRYTIRVYNPWPFQLPDDGTAPFEVPPMIVMLLSGYRLIIEPVKETPQYYTLVPVIPIYLIAR